MKKKALTAQNLLSEVASGTIANIVCQKNGRFRISASRKKTIIKKTDKVRHK